VARHGSVCDLGGQLADVEHVRHPASALISFASPLLRCATSSQMDLKIAPERASSLNLDRMVNSPVRHPHLRVVWELLTEFD